MRSAALPGRAWAAQEEGRWIVSMPAAFFGYFDGSVSLVIRLLHLGRDPTAIGDLHAVLLGPVADRL